jgi:Zn-finger nucleic acid-binding protein
MNCPACRKRSMYVVEHDDIELDVCADCQGIWFDAEELDLLLGGTTPRGLPSASGAAEKARPCPRCRKPMAKVNIGTAGGVTVDVCERNECGLWFDRGELRELCRDLAATGWNVDPAVRKFLSEVFPDLP